MKIKIIIIFFCLCIISCTQVKKEKTGKEAEQKVLKFVSIDKDCDLLLKCYKIFYNNNYLVANDKYDGKSLTIIDLKQIKKVKRLLAIGRGPNELMDIFYMKSIGVNFLQMGDMALEKLLVFSLDSLKSGGKQPERIFNYKDFTVGKNESLKRLVQINDSLFIGFGLFDSNQFILYKRRQIGKGYDIEYKYDYPTTKRKGYEEASNFNKYFIFAMRIAISPDQKHLLVSSMNCFYYQTFEIKNNELVKLSERIDYLPEYIFASNGMPIIKSDSKWGFINYPVATNEAAYLLERHRLYSEYGYYSSYTHILLRVGWDGVVKQKFELDRETQTITVDEENRRIYAIVLNQETLSNELGYYEF